MNSVTAPSFALASWTKLATSAVRSTKPARDVCTARVELTTELAATDDSGLSEIDFGKFVKPR